MPRIVNASLREESILALLPAPPRVRETEGVVWYDVKVGAESGLGGSVDAVDGDGKVVESIEVRETATGEFTGSITPASASTMTITFAITDVDGSTEIRAKLADGRDVKVSGSGKDAQLADGGDHEASAVGQRWEQAVDPLFTLAQAYKARARDGNSWGCTSCVVLLVAIEAAVLSESWPAALAGGATFIENCGGACA